MALYLLLSVIIGITFTRPVFLFEIDHDDGTVVVVTGILSRLETTYIT